MNRRTFIKKLFTSTLALFGLGGGTYYYAREIEPNLLTIHEETITSLKLSTKFNHFKIVQFSDTHIGFHYSLDQFHKLIKTLNELEPDIVVFTGDLVDMPHIYNWNNRLIQLLSDIHAPYGKFWIYGNHDHGGYGTDIVKDTMKSGGFELLQNNHTTIQKDGEFFNLAGLDDVMLGNPDVDSTVKNMDTEKFTFLLVHEPDFADQTKTYPIDVQLSGHSHGGQIQVPFIGYIYTPIHAVKYVEGKYTIGQHPLQLFVSRGVGTTRVPYRFLCRPEITIYHLANQ